MKQKGFTIVELLIVIVVIGILAAITIVSFNGVQNKAKLSAIQSDLENSLKSLEIAKTGSTTGDQYPANLAAANLKPSNGATPLYYVNSASNPTKYCYQETNGTLIYSVSSSSPIAAGACTITNLSNNPSLETGGSSWSGFSSAASSYSASTPTGGFAGSQFYRLTVNDGTNGAGGVYQYGIPVTAGKTYTTTAYTRINNAKAFQVCLEWHSPSAQLYADCGPSQTLTTAWTRLTATGVAPSTATSVTVTDYTITSGINGGDIIDVDAMMLTEGSQQYAYDDGSLDGWTWAGTAHTSNSTGPHF